MLKQLYQGLKIELNDFKFRVKILQEEKFALRKANEIYQHKPEKDAHNIQQSEIN